MRANVHTNGEYRSTGREGGRAGSVVAWSSAVLLVIVAIAVVGYVWRNQADQEHAWSPLPPAAEAPAAKAEPPAGPRHPIEHANVAPEMLPGAGANAPNAARAATADPAAGTGASAAGRDSTAAAAEPMSLDTVLQNTLAALFGTVGLDRFVNTDDFVRRFVVTVDNLVRQEVPERLAALKPVGERLLTQGSGETVTLDERNFARYTPAVRLIESVDTRRLVATYVRYYPHFQNQYVELGYPQGHFNDRLVDAIDSLLATPQVGGPIRLVQPRVLWQFEDPYLEGLPAGQKALLRMGPENARRVQAKLREIRAELTAKAPKE